MKRSDIALSVKEHIAPYSSTIKGVPSIHPLVDPATAVQSLPDSLRHRIGEVFAKDYVNTWWVTGLKRLDNVTPYELFSQGRVDTIERVLSIIEQGLPA